MWRDNIRKKQAQKINDQFASGNERVDIESRNRGNFKCQTIKAKLELSFMLQRLIKIQTRNKNKIKGMVVTCIVSTSNWIKGCPINLSVWRKMPQGKENKSTALSLKPDSLQMCATNKVNVLKRIFDALVGTWNYRTKRKRHQLKRT